MGERDIIDIYGWCPTSTSVTLTVPMDVDTSDPIDARHAIRVKIAADLARIVESSAWAASIGLVTATTTHQETDQ